MDDNMVEQDLAPLGFLSSLYVGGVLSGALAADRKGAPEVRWPKLEEIAVRSKTAGHWPALPPPALHLAPSLTVLSSNSSQSPV